MRCFSRLVGEAGELAVVDEADSGPRRMSLSRSQARREVPATSEDAAETAPGLDEDDDDDDDPCGQDEEDEGPTDGPK
jgi:hypothetical protein